MKRKRIFLLVLLFISVFVLSSCKPKDEQNNKNLATNDFFTATSVDELTEMVRPKETKMNIFEKFFSVFGFAMAEDALADVDLEPESTAPNDLYEALNSKTNVQFEGVDEADVVKNDERYIYFGSKNKVKVVDSITDKVYSYQIPNFYPHEMFLADNYLVVFGGITTPLDIEDDKELPSYLYYSHDFLIVILDIQDVTNIKETRRIKIDRTSLISSRRIEDNYYFMLQSRYVFDQENDTAIIPTYYDTLVGERTLALENIHVMGLENYYSYHNLILSFNISKNEEVFLDSYVGSFGSLFSSLDNLYIVNTQYNPSNSVVTTDESRLFPWFGLYKDLVTNIYRFEYQGDQVIYRYKTLVPGAIKDQFSMDEYENNFRIVSTNHNSQTETFAYNFALEEDGFKLTSKVGGMGINERVYSVRFENELCYVVTFRQVDPLYIVDFSDVDYIKVIGEYKTPGYSTYLHKYSEDLLIGVGDDASEDGRILGGKISLFDVSDPDNIKEPDIYKFGNYISFYNNHKAIIVLKESHLFGLPMSDGKFYLFIIDDVNQTITLAKKVDIHETIRRGVIVNSKLYCIGINNLSVTKLDTFETIFLSNLSK